MVYNLAYLDASVSDPAPHPRGGKRLHYGGDGLDMLVLVDMAADSLFST